MPDETIILVNSKGVPIGTSEKLMTHNANTPLHLAFSCYIFDENGSFLITQRAHIKKVWPDVWTNSVCGHPEPDEDIETAIKRRLDYELGMTASDIQNLVSDYIYKTPPYKGIIEHEYCPIYIARATSMPRPNSAEVKAYKWLGWSDFVAEAQADTNDTWSWWCKDQLRLIADHPLIKEYSKGK